MNWLQCNAKSCGTYQACDLQGVDKDNYLKLFTAAVL